MSKELKQTLSNVCETILKRIDNKLDYDEYIHTLTKTIYDLLLEHDLDDLPNSFYKLLISVTSIYLYANSYTRAFDNKQFFNIGKVCGALSILNEYVERNRDEEELNLIANKYLEFISIFKYMNSSMCCTINEISENTDVSEKEVKKVLAQLNNKGLFSYSVIGRNPVSKERVVTIHISTRGKRLLEKMNNIKNAALTLTPQNK